MRKTLCAIDRVFRILQFGSASLYSLGPWRQRREKTMGIISGLLFAQGHLGRNSMSHVGRLTPMQGFCAETGGAVTLFAATWLGIPVSTTHTITGAIVGVGAARRVSACAGMLQAMWSPPGFWLYLLRSDCGSTPCSIVRVTDYLNRKLSRESWPIAVQPISFMSRSISLRIKPRARSTPPWPAGPKVRDSSDRRRRLWRQRKAPSRRGSRAGRRHP